MDMVNIISDYYFTVSGFSRFTVNWVERLKSLLGETDSAMVNSKRQYSCWANISNQQLNIR